jgi:hypothetical protein
MKFLAISGLVFCGSLFAQCAKTNANSAPFFQGEEISDNRYAAGYNAAAKPYLKDKYPNNKYNEWISNLTLDVAFTYWYAAQDGMDLATSADLTLTGAAESDVTFNNGAVPLMQSFEYNPGFQIAAGWGNEEWEMKTRYTWFRQTNEQSSSAPTDQVVSGSLGVWYVSDWFAQAVGTHDNNISATSLSSSWKLGMDIVDMVGGRPYYQSKRIVINPFGGVRLAWIRQSLRLKATVPSQAIFATAESNTLAPQPIVSHNRSNSWGLGPVFGAKGFCLLGKGFRLEGNGGLSVLFTQYTTLSHSEDSAVAGSTPSVYKFEQTNYNTVRPAANLALGLGWAKYFNNEKYHFDFSADYEFNVLWNQNMLRSFAQEFTLGTYASNDLFLHGLTLNGQFQF